MATMDVEPFWKESRSWSMKHMKLVNKTCIWFAHTIAPIQKWIMKQPLLLQLIVSLCEESGGHMVWKNTKWAWKRYWMKILKSLKHWGRGSKNSVVRLILFFLHSNCYTRLHLFLTQTTSVDRRELHQQGLRRKRSLFPKCARNLIQHHESFNV